MTTSTNPWDANFVAATVDPALVTALENAMAVASQATAAAGNVLPDVTQAVTGAVTSVIPPSIPPVGTGGGGGPAGNIPASSIANLEQALENAIGDAAKGSVSKALQDMAPTLESELVKEWQGSLQRVVTKVSGGATTPQPTPTLEDFTHADARNRAFRTLLGGLVLAILTGLTTALTSLAGVNWFTHTGQVAAVSITISAVVTSVGAYISRLVKEPASTAPLSAQLVSKNP